MIQVNIHEAKSRLSELLARMQAGEEVVIAKAGVPIAKLIPATKRKKRVFGALEGKVTIPDSFYEPLPDDIIEAMEGGK